jgi:glycerol-3-phosphate cytidylyltransferase
MKKYRKGVTFGVFDLFHVGHLNLLKQAKEQCEFLIVGISTDKYSQEKKGKQPVIPFLERFQIVQAIKDVDWATIQDDTYTKAKTAETFNADVIFVGSDWKGKQWDGAKLGIPVVYIPYTEHISTTKVITKIQNA